jgi:predicted amidohydrolase
MSESPPGSGPSPNVRLSDFEKRIRLRQLTIEDYPALVEMQKLCFPGMRPWGEEQIRSQIEIFPRGQLCLESNGRLVASSNSLVVDSDMHTAWHDWTQISDEGMIRTHSESGDTLYGIEIMVHPDFGGMHLARRLYDARKALCREMNLARIVIGGRIPGYGAHADELTAREYAEKVISRGLYDPVLTTQVANGFVLRELIPDYFPADEASRGYATHLEWTNLDHVPDPSRRWHRVSMTRICAVQYRMRHIESWEDFATQCAFFVDAAANNRVDFVVFPELLTNQLMAVEPGRRPADAVRTLAELTPRYLELFSGLSVKHNVNIVGGSQFTLDQSGRLQNVSYLFRRDGTIARQAKLHIPADERRWWGLEGGDRLDVFDTDRGRVAILVSYDIQFPELARIAVDHGAQILFVPFTAEDRHSYLRVRYCCQARAVENEVFVAAAGTTGNLPFVTHADTHYARSGIFTPLDFSFARDGVAGESTENVETLVTADVDLELLRRQRLGGTVRLLADRRPDLYRVEWTGRTDDA